MWFPSQASGIQSEEFKACHLYTLLVERRKSKQTKHKMLSYEWLILLTFEDYIIYMLSYSLLLLTKTNSN